MRKRARKGVKRDRSSLWFGFILILLVILAAAYFTFKMTGLAVSASGTSVVRSVSVINGTDAVIDLTIKTNQKVLAIAENMNSGTEYANETIYSYGLFDNSKREVTAKYEVFVFKPSEATWIIADKEISLNNLHLRYSVHVSKARTIDGRFLYSVGNDTAVGKISGESSTCPSTNKICKVSSSSVGQCKLASDCAVKTSYTASCTNNKCSYSVTPQCSLAKCKKVAGKVAIKCLSNGQCEYGACLADSDCPKSTIIALKVPICKVNSDAAKNVCYYVQCVKNGDCPLNSGQTATCKNNVCTYSKTGTTNVGIR